MQVSANREAEQYLLQLVAKGGHHTMVSNLSMLVHNALDIDIQSKMSS